MKNILGIVLGIVFCFVSCAAPGSISDGGAMTPSCRANTDCRGRAYCQNGQCVAMAGAPATCRADRDCVDVVTVDGGVALAYPDGGDPDPVCNFELGLCTRCRAIPQALRRSNGPLSEGCQFGQECLEERGECVWVSDTCQSEARARSGEDCDPGHPHCVSGRCAECTRDSDCDRYGDPAVRVRCRSDFTCEIQSAGYCETAADCDDGERCTRDICRSETNRCEHVAIPGCGTPPSDGGVSPPPPAGSSAVLMWTRGGNPLASIVMSAKLDPDPVRIQSAPLVELCRVANDSTITCVQTGLSPGMYLEVTVEYRETVGGLPSWSCLGNGTAGTANGTLTGVVNGVSLVFRPVSNGLPLGCNLEAIVP